MKKLTALILAIISLMSLSLTSCAYSPNPEDGRVVLTVGGEKIYYDYFRYVFLNAKRDLDGGDEKYWENNEDGLDALKKTVLETIVHNRAIELLAKEHKVALTSDEKKGIADYVKSLKKTDASFEEGLEDSYLTEYSFLYIQTFTELWRKIYDYITSDINGIIKSDDATVRKDVPVNFRRVRYVMLKIDEKDPEKTLTDANYILNKAKDGEDFVSLVRSYSEDADMVAAASDGCYYTLGQFQPEFESAVEKLADNGISDPVSVGGHYFIIQRLPADMEYVEKNLDEFITMYKARIFNEMVAELEKTVTVKTSKLWDSLQLSDVK